MPKRSDISKTLIMDVRSVVIGVYFLFMAAGALGECVTVEQNYKSSSRNVRVTAVREKKLLKDVKIELPSSKKHGGFTLSTNDAGVAILPTLKPGKQCITATAPDGVEADLCLEVSPTIEDKTSEFSIELPPTLAQQALATAERMPVGDSLRVFSGIVKDASGAGVPGTHIDVFRKQPLDKTDIIEIKADDEGKFSADLTDGIYMAFFRASGFRTHIVVFEVGKNQPPKNLQVALEIGGC